MPTENSSISLGVPGHVSISILKNPDKKAGNTDTTNRSQLYYKTLI